jgi:hypothetical protein
VDAACITCGAADNAWKVRRDSFRDPSIGACARALRPAFRLTEDPDGIELVLFLSVRITIMIAVCRFQEIIGGRVYNIEASRVRDDRWRAQITRLPGTPTALMPFYGETADEAARLLFDWLVRAHRATSTTA